MLSKSQIIYLQTARRQAGITDDPAWRMILRSTGKVESCKDLDNAGFEAVMAVLEDMGFRDRNKPGDHWRNQAAGNGQRASSRQVHAIIRLAQSCRYSLPTLCARATDQRTKFVEHLTPKEAWDMIEMLKAVNARELKRNPAGDYEREAISDEATKRRSDEVSSIGSRQSAIGNSSDRLVAAQAARAAVTTPCEIKDDHDDIPF